VNLTVIASDLATSTAGTDLTCLGGAKVTASISVSKAALRATANATMTYGADIPSFTVSYSGFVNSVGPGVVDNETTTSTTAVNSTMRGPTRSPWPVGVTTATPSPARMAP